MPPARLATPIFGAIARTATARELLSPDGLGPMVALWGASSPNDWWIDRAAGLALYRPEAVIRSCSDSAPEAVLCIRGSVHTEDRAGTPRGWDLEGSSDPTLAILGHLLDRDSAAVPELRGQFALAVWDGSRRRLLLARDHLGQRAMFVHTTRQFYWFCSELAPLLTFPGSTAALDFESAFWLLAMGMSNPDGTLHARIARLPAAHVGEWRPGGPIIE